MFVTALFVIAKNGKQLDCSSTGEWLNTPWYIHTMQFYSAIKGNELLTHATIWMNLQRIMMSEKKANPKKLYSVWFCLHNIPKMKEL